MIKHKIINNIEYKYCNTCSTWKILDDFGRNHKTKNTLKSNCKKCVNKKRHIKCNYDNCDTYAVNGYKFCVLHGAPKCLLCNTPARHGINYCIKHNPAKCKHTNCNNKSLDNTNYCLTHNDDYKCNFDGCTKKKRKNGFCIKHGAKEYCTIEGCNKVLQLEGKCDEHFCSGNIIRIGKRLINNTKRNDKEYKGNTRVNPRENTLSCDHIVSLYDKNKNCHWCNFPVKLELGGNFDLDRISIDRIDNTIGHTNDNCVISCIFCNYAKNVYTKEQWIQTIDILNGNINTINFNNTPVNNNMIKYMTGILKEKKKYNINTVDRIWIFNQLNKTKWICELSGIPIYSTTQSRYPFNVSIDRINNNEYHINNNCQVVCSFINNGKNKLPNDEFKIWFKNRFPNCKINKVIYPREFYDKILCKDKDTYLSMISDENIKVYFV